MGPTGLTTLCRTCHVRVLRVGDEWLAERGEDYQTRARCPSGPDGRHEPLPDSRP